MLVQLPQLGFLKLGGQQATLTLTVPQLSVEFIIEADPDLIFVTDCCGESLETVSSRAGWESLSAVQSGSVFVVDDDIASRWGPRTIEFLQAVADAVASAVSG